MLQSVSLKLFSWLGFIDDIDMSWIHCTETQETFLERANTFNPSGLPPRSVDVDPYTNKNIKLSSFTSSEKHSKEGGWPDSTVSINQFSSVTLNELAINTRKKAYYNFEFLRGSQSKDLYKGKGRESYWIRRLNNPNLSDINKGD